MTKNRQRRLSIIIAGCNVLFIVLILIALGFSTKITRKDVQDIKKGTIISWRPLTYGSNISSYTGTAAVYDSVKRKNDTITFTSSRTNMPINSNIETFILYDTSWVLTTRESNTHF